MLVDNIAITVKAGSGGRGAVAFSHIMMALGPTGGSGGRGGNVYLEVVSDLGALRHFRSKKNFTAEDGRDGRSSFRDGRDGEDLALRVPRGTVVHKEGSPDRELTRIGERVLAARGGGGGKGNFQYKSATNISPKEFQPGLPGEECVLRLELKLIADIGLIGLPNAGKSSFLNEVTNAKSRVGNYAFTTLEPHLGAYYGLILADLPGLIEGASSGKGLGVKFLRHIERTRILFHFIDSNTEHPVKDYEVVRRELGAYNRALLEKPEYIFFTKSDTVENDRLLEIQKMLQSHIKEKEIMPISIHNSSQMDAVKKLLNRIA